MIFLKHYKIKMVIKSININEYQDYINLSKKEGLMFCGNTKLFGLFIDNKIVGFTGVLFVKNKVIFKNHFVLHEYRGMGYFKYLLEFSIKLIQNMGYKTIEANCTPMSIKEYIKRGFDVVKIYRNGIKKVRKRYENIQ